MEDKHFEKTLRDDILSEIEKIVQSRKKEMPEDSYVAQLLGGGEDNFLRKVSEEACELILASKNNDRENIVHETADLLFHVLVLLGFHNIPIEEVYDELKSRFKTD